MIRILAALPLGVLGAAWFLFLSIPWPITLAFREPDRTAFMTYRLREAERLGQALEIRYDWVPLDRISPNLRRAVLVAEDDRFYQHAGVDWHALREEVRYTGDDDFSWLSLDDWRAVLVAVRYVLENRDGIRGRSTITQQVAKNLYYTPERSLVRKVEEFVVARRLERFLDKERILELYLNIAEWGPGVFGAEAAARHYFNRSAAELTRAQSAALAATLPQPLTANPAHQPGRIAWRQRLILDRMGGQGPPVPPPDLIPEVATPDPIPATQLGEPAPAAEVDPAAKVEAAQDVERSQHGAGAGDGSGSGDGGSVRERSPPEIEAVPETDPAPRVEVTPEVDRPPSVDPGPEVEEEVAPAFEAEVAR